MKSRRCPEIVAWTTLDVNYSYVVDNLFGGEATLFFGARNLTDKDPPPLPTGREGIHRYNLRPGFDGFVHDIKAARSMSAFASARRTENQRLPFGHRAVPGS